MLLKLTAGALIYVFAGVTVCSYGMPRLSYSKRAAIKQAIEMQRLCYTGAQLLDGDMRGAADKEARARVATALGNLVRNWSVLQESVRVLKGDPMPGSLKPQPKPVRRYGRPRREVVWPVDPDPTPLPPA